jgi:putative heme degradation protein
MITYIIVILLVCMAVIFLGTMFVVAIFTGVSETVKSVKDQFNR